MTASSRTRIVYVPAALCALVVLLDTERAAAQDETGTSPERTRIEGTNVTREDHMGPDDQPEPPGKVDPDELKDAEPTVIAGAGAGSDIAYATQGVVELGGTLALTHSSETTTFRISPSAGYFVVDNIELTLFPELSVLHIEGSTDVSVGGVLEPSYHLPITDRFFAFAGIGVGAKYAEDPGFDLFFRPRVGLDIMVGRSGILKPAGFMDVGVNDGLTGGGVEAGFTVML